MIVIDGVNSVEPESNLTMLSPLLTLVIVSVSVLVGSAIRSSVMVKSIAVESGWFGSFGSISTLPLAARLVSLPLVLPETL